MDLNVAKKQGIPLYIQIKEQILSEIRNQGFKPGQKMPTERELAQRLGTSRNTISSAYQLLEKEGVLVSHQGRGTFVAGEYRAIHECPVISKIHEVIDAALEQAMSEGLSTDDFLAVVGERVREKEELLKKVKAVFVECNIEQARVFAGELGEITHYSIRPVVLADLRKDQSLLADAEFIFTTFAHLDEVRQLAAAYNVDIRGVAVKPCLEGIVRIARYGKGTKFGIVSLSDEFYEKFLRNLLSAGLENLDMFYTSSTSPDEVKQVLELADVVIASPGRCQEVKQLVNGEKEVIVFNTTLDIGSVRAVLSDAAAEKQ
jgi:DNA-binding transcriptional regulator YhcF (GntR family)